MKYDEAKQNKYWEPPNGCELIIIGTVKKRRAVTGDDSLYAPNPNLGKYNCNNCGNWLPPEEMNFWYEPWHQSGGHYLMKKRCDGCHYPAIKRLFRWIWNN